MDEVHDALRRLGSESFTERLAAARELNRFRVRLSRDDDRIVREALATESVPWVRGALSAILDQDGDGLLREGVVIPAPVWDEELAGFDPEVARAAITMATGRVLQRGRCGSWTSTAGGLGRTR